MILTGKEKAVVAFIVTLITALVGVLSPLVTDPHATSIIQVVAAVVSVVGTTLGVYQVSNKTTAPTEPADV